MSKIEDYVNKVNEVLKSIDWLRLKKPEYKEEIAEKLKEYFKEIYGKYWVLASDCVDDEGFAVVPAYVTAKDGNIYLGLLEICAMDSGEHYGTHFLFPEKGIVDQEEFGEKLTEEERDSIFPYKYRPLIPIADDIHTDAYF